MRFQHLPASLLLLASWAFAAPPPALERPDAAQLAAITDRTARLSAAVEALRGKVPDEKLVDVEICHKASAWMSRHDEWHPGHAKGLLTALDRGLDRAAQLQAGKAPWLTRAGKGLRAYRSALDGSVQPFGVVLPEGYPGDRAWRLDVVLHGRDATLTEVKWIQQFDNPAPKNAKTPEAKPRPDPDGEPPFVELHVYGRGNNAYRWAGERDVFEALDAFQASERRVHGRNPVDPSRIVLRGFSMGGAGAWHLGLHHPDRWCSVSPGAGFASTSGFERNPGGKLPPYVNLTLGIYESVDYAENLFNTPFVAYAGDDDPQREAWKVIEARIKGLGLKPTFIGAPKTGHKYHPDALREIMRLQGEHARKGRPAYPAKVSFTTMTPKYPRCDWVEVLQQKDQYKRSLVDAEAVAGGWRITTDNVRQLRLSLPRDKVAAGPAPNAVVEIDGRRIEAVPIRGAVLLGLSIDGWRVSDPDAWAKDAKAGAFKTTGMTGPIDDAFMDAFLCVRGTGKPWHPATAQHIDAELARFSAEWNKWFRGDLPVKRDVDVTPEDIAAKHLVLFGDPSSNSLVAQALPGLPLRWTRDTITFAGVEYAAGDHVPLMIRPSPLAPGKYLVLNSGHTFHTPQFLDTNRSLYPRLGDHAILRPRPDAKDPVGAEVVAAGLFDASWRLP